MLMNGVTKCKYVRRQQVKKAEIWHLEISRQTFMGQTYICTYISYVVSAENKILVKTIRECVISSRD